MAAPPGAQGLPPNAAAIEVHVSDLKELFNSFDPTPFHKRDLDPDAEEFIASWARDLPPSLPLGLLVHADRAVTSPNATEIVHQAVRDHFKRKANETRQQLRLLFKNGRIALVIGLAVVAGSVIAGDAVETMLRESRFGSIIRESLLIGGWVAMWRPLEVFLYEWWPIRAEARLFDRLSAMTVRVVPHDAAHD
jgi:hypothetical protein